MLQKKNLKKRQSFEKLHHLDKKDTCQSFQKVCKNYNTQLNTFQKIVLKITFCENWCKKVFELLRDMRFKLIQAIYTHFIPSNFQDNPGIQENPGILYRTYFIANIVCLEDKFRKHCLGDITVCPTDIEATKICTQEPGPVLGNLDPYSGTWT